MSIIIAIVATFIVTAGWQLVATNKIRANHRLMTAALFKDLNEMAIKLGHKDFISYLSVTKGEQYANIAAINLKSFYESFTDRGVD